MRPDVSGLVAERVAVNQRKCRYCNALITWGKNEFGKKIPLDLKAPVYTIRSEREDVDGCVHVERVPPGSVGVNHWTTCPGREQAKADQAKRQTEMGAAMERAKERQQ